MRARHANWDRMGAASGLLATLLFVVAFAVFLSTSPGGDPALPNIKHAEQAPAYIAANLSAVRVVILLNALGLALFLWFLAALWRELGDAEDGASRGSTAALAGGVASAVLVLAGLAMLATAGLSTSSGQAETAATMYTAGALLIAFGIGVSSIFFFAASRAIAVTAALPRWLGPLAFVAGLLAVCGFMTPFFEANVLNAATGALGHWAGTAAFVIWLGLASAVMSLEQHRRSREPDSGQPLSPPAGEAA